MTQTARILALLRERPEGITALDALREVGSFRLAARILDLHREGYAITSDIETLPNGKRIARYILHEEPVQLAFRLSSERADGSAPKLGVARSDDGRMAVTARPGAG